MKLGGDAEEVRAALPVVPPPPGKLHEGFRRRGGCLEGVIVLPPAEMLGG